MRKEAARVPLSTYLVGQGLALRTTKPNLKRVFLVQLLRTYLADKQFLLDQACEVTYRHSIQSGVLQGNLLGPIIQILYNTILPTTLLLL